MAIVGVIGLGLMGGAMAARLVETGHTVHGFDTDEHSRERAAENGVRAHAEVATLLAEVRVVVTSLPNSAIVRSVWLGERGLLRSARPGSILIEVSTIDAATMRELGGAAPEGLRVIDAPVTGGPVEARSGALGLFLGGEPDVIAEADPVLSSLARTIHHAGPIGCGKIVKLANNVMSAANIVVAAEAFGVAVASGMDPARLYEVLSVSGGTSNQFVKRFPWVLEGDFDPRFTVRLAAKDLGLALDAAREAGVPAPATAAAREVYQVAIAEGHGNADMVVVSDIYQSWGKGNEACH